jgi:hypothetical protein
VALRILELVEDDAAMLIKLGHLARVGANPALAQEADESISRSPSASRKLALRSGLSVLKVVLSWVDAIGSSARNAL